MRVSVSELLAHLRLPLSIAIVLIGGLAAYLLLRSSQLDRFRARTDEERQGLAAARDALRQSRTILLRATLRALLLIVLLFGAVLVLNRL